MSMYTERLIGLADERVIEKACGVDELHIGWQQEYAEQRQVAPNGQVYRAPVVSWWRNGQMYQCVPRLAFQAVTREPQWFDRLLGIKNGEQWQVDVEALVSDIKKHVYTNQGAEIATVA